MSAIYSEGLPHGWTKSWSRDRQVLEERFFQEGKKQGKHIGFWLNGKKKFEYNYRDDIFHGEVKEWFESGQMYRHFNYEYGQEAGMQKMWKTDSRIKANYEVIDGRKYGLTGVKNYESVWAEVDSVLNEIGQE